MNPTEVVELNDLDQHTYEQLLGRALPDIREHLDERISRGQVERVLLASEAHPYDVLEALQHLALIVGTDNPCPRCGDFDCIEDHCLPSGTPGVFRIAECDFCEVRYELSGQSLITDTNGRSLNQCATCARIEARGGPERAYPTTDWQLGDRVELLEWLPDDRVVLVTHA